MKILLANLMCERNLTVRQVSIMTGIPSATVNRIANGKTNPTMIQMEQLAKGLKVRINDLFQSDLQ